MHAGHLLGSAPGTRARWGVEEADLGTGRAGTRKQLQSVWSQDGPLELAQLRLEAWACTLHPPTTGRLFPERRVRRVGDLGDSHQARVVPGKSLSCEPSAANTSSSWGNESLRSKGEISGACPSIQLLSEDSPCLF